MDFWSKGLGKRTVCVDLAHSEAVKSGDVLYLKGTMEEPVTWDYIMRLQSEDIVEFMAMLRDPGVADYIWASPRRWRLYGRLLVGGVVLVWLLAVAMVRALLGRTPVEEPKIELPPPVVRKRRTTAGRRLVAPAADGEAEPTPAAASMVAAESAAESGPDGEVPPAPKRPTRRRLTSTEARLAVVGERSRPQPAGR